jgi:hypothetical protein
VSVETWKQLSLWIHVPLVVGWVGFVMFDLFAALTPGLSLDQRGRMIAWSRWFVVAAIVLIMVTGIYQTIYNPVGPEVTSWATLQELKDKEYGFALFIKHGFVLATFVLTIVVRFGLAPRLLGRGDGAVSGGGAVAAGALSTDRTIVWLSALNLLACLGALLYATRMIWLLH